MMLTNLPWPEVLLGTAAALAVLVLYDVFYVWPIHRRISSLPERCAVLERSLGGVLEDLAARLQASDHRGREDLGKLGERLGQLELATEARSYEQAIGCAERGEESARLILLRVDRRRSRSRAAAAWRDGATRCRRQVRSPTD
jgi:hypothetical protein